jgi:hypothetical protein
MLRVILLTIGVLLLGVAPIAVLAGWPAHLISVPAVLGIVLTAGILFERGRYKPPSSRRLGPDWVATSERFVDPTSGKIVAVFYQPTTGERRYALGITKRDRDAFTTE